MAVWGGQGRLRHLVRNWRVEAGRTRGLLSLLDHPDCQVVEQVVALGCQLLRVQTLIVQTAGARLVVRSVGVERLRLVGRRERGQHLPSLAHNLISLRLH